MTTDTIGGVWTYALELARALEASGVRIALATMGRPLSAAQRTDIESLPHVRVYESSYKLEWMQQPWGDVRAASLWLLRIAEEFRPDLVHLNDYSQGALHWNRPVLVVGHSCVYSWFLSVRGEPPGPEWERYHRQVSAGLRAADLVVAPTRTMLAQLRREYGDFQSGEVIYNGRRVVPGRPRTRQPFVLSAGRLWDEAKNVGLLGGIADRVDWPIYVAGESRHPDGTGCAEYPALNLLGPLAQHEMPDLYCMAGIYALPARYEPFGLTPLEAALCGCPLVLGDIQTLREIWQEAALFVDPGDPQAWQRAINSLISDPSGRLAMAAKARHRARRFSASRMAEEYLAAYVQLLESSPVPEREEVP